LDYIDGKKMYLHILELLKTFPLSPKIIVTQYDEIVYCASEYGFEAILNKEPEIGISHSIHLGLNAALERSPSLDGVMFGVCDQPYLKRSTIERLFQAFSSTDKNIVALTWQESIGNPCIFGRKYYDELLALTCDVGGKKVLKRHPEDVERVMVQEEKELIDIDTKDKDCH
jgi:CTP:molybdopterin cytidylyltransferase MocA